MPTYRRLLVPGGTYFLTLAPRTARRCSRNPTARQLLRGAVADCRRRRPFDLEAAVLLDDHLHFLITLPQGDADFSTRVAAIKAAFTRAFLAAGGAEQPRSAARVRKRRRGVWQRWFWEHCIRDVQDFNRHLDYIHYNPVKHGLAACPHAWPHSSFPRHVRRGAYEPEWQCSCDGRTYQLPDFSGLAVGEIEGECVQDSE
jgi:putative transposase